MSDFKTIKQYISEAVKISNKQNLKKVDGKLSQHASAIVYHTQNRDVYEKAGYKAESKGMSGDRYFDKSNKHNDMVHDILSTVKSSHSDDAADAIERHAKYVVSGKPDHVEAIKIRNDYKIDHKKFQ